MLYILLLSIQMNIKYVLKEKKCVLQHTPKLLIKDNLAQITNVKKIVQQ